MELKHIHSSLFLARERFLYYFLLSCLCMLVFFAVFDFYHQLYWACLTDIIALLLVAISFFSLLKHGLKIWQIHVTLFGGLCLFGPLLIVDSFGDTGIYWLSTLLVMVFMVGGVRIGLYWGGAYVLVLLASILSASLGWVALLYSGEQIAFMFLVTVFTGLICYYFARFLEQAAADNLDYQHQLEAVSIAKSNFLSVMSHELRTPLHGIISMQELLIKDMKHFSTEQQECLQLSLHSSKTLKTLLNDILDLAKIEAGCVDVSHESFDLLRCVREALIPFLFSAKDKGLELSLHLDAVPQHVIGDETHIRQALSNLLGNSIKFTTSGFVRLHVQTHPDLAGHLQFSVSDSGCGIGSDQLEHIFDPFVQCYGTTSDIKGSGLGTSIVKDFVELLGGEVSVVSEVDKGSCFSFHVPLPSDSSESYQLSLPAYDVASFESAKDMPSATALDGKPENIRVLLVDDDLISRKITAKQLQRVGMPFDIAIHGQAALDLLGKEDYQAILTDLRMPVMDGVALTKHVRAKESLSGNHEPIIIIALSSHVLGEAFDDALAAGMDGFLSKPVKPEQILEAVLQAQHNRQAQVSKPTHDKNLF